MRRLPLVALSLALLGTVPADASVAATFRIELDWSVGCDTSTTPATCTLELLPRVCNQGISAPSCTTDAVTVPLSGTGDRPVDPCVQPVYAWNTIAPRELVVHADVPGDRVVLRLYAAVRNGVLAVGGTTDPLAVPGAQATFAGVGVGVDLGVGCPAVTGGRLYGEVAYAWV